MRCVMVMFDSLNRRMLPPYAPDTWVHAPNFARLAERSATFETSYVCSMPCMPARRDWHSGRPSFLHCGWGPLEPFDDSVPEMLREAGVYTHLCTDHYHYWEDGGSTYHNRYDSYEFFRGQEGDRFIGQVREPAPLSTRNTKSQRSDSVNREHIRDDADYPQSQTFRQGVRFLDRNADEDNWFLHIECFDPHEPFTCHRGWRDRYPPDPDDVMHFDWPGYQPVEETEEEVEAARRNYAALLTKCDASLGDVLDAFDRHDLWRDTMLVVWTDHGYFLGERGLWAKNYMPMTDEIARTPLFVWDPRHSETAGGRRKALVQPAIDLGPTVLRYFGQEPTPRMRGCDLAPVLADDTPVREAAVFGYHGAAVNVTDGRHVYLRPPRDESNGPLYEYTLLPLSMRGFKATDDVELAPASDWSAGRPVLRRPVNRREAELWATAGHLLFDTQADPGQVSPIDNEAVRSRLETQMAELFAAYDAPSEQYERMGLPVSLRPG